MRNDETRLPEWLMNATLSTGAKLTYAALAAAAAGQQTACLGQAKLASLVSASVRSVQRHLAELAGQGLISVSKNAGSGLSWHVYTLNRLEEGAGC